MRDPGTQLAATAIAMLVSNTRIANRHREWFPLSGAMRD